MFRFLISILAVVGLASLISGAPFSGTAIPGGGVLAAGVGFLFLLPFLLFKVVFIVLLIGFIGRLWGRGSAGSRTGCEAMGSKTWRRTGRAASDEAATASQPEEERFREWHDLHHARKEVDSWAPPVTDL